MIAFRYSYSRLFTAASAAGFLVLFIAAVFLWWYMRRIGAFRADGSFQATLAFGLLLGCLWVIEIGINNFIAPPLPQRDIIDNIFWFLVGLGILLVSAVQTFQTGQLRTGIQAGLWTGFISGLMACSMALSMVVFGMRWVTRDPLNVAEWAARGPQTGAPSMAAYFAYETFAGAFLHLLVLGLGMGFLLGLLGGLAGKVTQMILQR